MTDEVSKRDKIEKSLLDQFQKYIDKQSTIPEVKKDTALEILTNQSITSEGILTVNV